MESILDLFFFSTFGLGSPTSTSDLFYRVLDNFRFHRVPLPNQIRFDTSCCQGVRSFLEECVANPLSLLFPNPPLVAPDISLFDSLPAQTMTRLPDRNHPTAHLDKFREKRRTHAALLHAAHGRLS